MSSEAIHLLREIRDELRTISEALSKKRGGYKRKKGPDSPYSEPFIAFWAAYPRKESKGFAWETWNKWEADGKLVQILATLERYKQTEQWTRDKGQFIPLPATWLNRRSWEDEPGAQNNGYAPGHPCFGHHPGDRWNANGREYIWFTDSGPKSRRQGSDEPWKEIA